MNAKIYSVDGKPLRETGLPEQFSAIVDRGLIKRAVLAIQSAKVQTKHPAPLTGRDNTAAYIGARGKPTMHRTINVGAARKPRLRNRRGILMGNVAGIPAVVGGPKAHPPKALKKWAEKINRKEKRKATVSAIAATARKELVMQRGHALPHDRELPLIVEEKFEEVGRTKKVKEALEALGVWQDVERATAKRVVRAGKGRKRGRHYKERKSVLIVTGGASSVSRGARNIPGIDIATIGGLNADLLAPGGVPGRLTLWTESAVKKMCESGEGKNMGAAELRLHAEKGTIGVSGG